MQEGRAFRPAAHKTKTIPSLVQEKGDGVGRTQRCQTKIRLIKGFCGDIRKEGLHQAAQEKSLQQLGISGLCERAVIFQQH